MTSARHASGVVGPQRGAGAVVGPTEVGLTPPGHTELTLIGVWLGPTRGATAGGRYA
jgi:hypothetical protein